LASGRTAGVALPPSSDPFTSPMSSFGSWGSSRGARRASARGIEMTPKPVLRSNPARPTSRAENRSRLKSWSLVSRGRADQIQLAAAATIGAEKEVPLTLHQPAASGTSALQDPGATKPSPTRSKPAGIAPTTPTPGALTSFASFRFENGATTSPASVAATVRTCGKSAGKVSGFGRLASWNSLPAAATSNSPRRWA
jgi:hypothetical protein